MLKSDYNYIFGNIISGGIVCKDDAVRKVIFDEYTSTLKRLSDRYHNGEDNLCGEYAAEDALLDMLIYWYDYSMTEEYINSGTITTDDNDLRNTIAEFVIKACDDYKQQYNKPRKLSLLHIIRMIISEMSEYMFATDNYMFNNNTVYDDINAIATVIATIMRCVEQSVCTNDRLVRMFHDVHKNNMSKVDNDGNFILNENGKVLKPDGWISMV